MENAIINLECTRNRLSAGLCPDLLGELTREQTQRAEREIEGGQGENRRRKGKVISAQKSDFVTCVVKK